jgi:diacylglycerol kinase family enzyme
MLRGTAQQDRDFAIVCAAKVRLEIEPSCVPVSVDGEVAMTPTPLDYRLHVDALRVRVPEASH